VDLDAFKVEVYIADLQPLGPRWVQYPAVNGDPEYIMVPNGGPKANCKQSTCENRVTIPVRFSSSWTEYKIRLYAKGPTGQDDSFWVHVDGVNRSLKPFCNYGFNLGRRFAWWRGSSCENFITVSGNPGEVHEVTITPREDGSMLAGVRFTGMN